jgi:hypothetical protein
MNVDTFLQKVEKYGFDNLPKTMHSRDVKILKNLATAISSNRFITENQSNLLIKILFENYEKLLCVDTEIRTYLKTPTWSQPFRKVDQTKKIFTSKDPTTGEPLLVIEFAFNSSIRKILNNLSKDIPEGISSPNGRVYITPLTEKNIVEVIDNMAPFKFDIHEPVKTFYETIKSWNFEEIRDKYVLENIPVSNLKAHLENNIGDISSSSPDMLVDRSVRYQYFLPEKQGHEKSVKNSIIFRKNPHVWIDSNEHTLSSVIEEVKKLNRFPLLVVFDTFAPKQAIAYLEDLHASLENVKISEKIGIYFRFDNSEGIEFNKFIADKKYNHPLDIDSNVAGIASNKIPKFFIKSDWYPMTVISLGHKLRSTKSGIYSNMCDLIIEYSPTKSLSESRNVWLQ